MFKNSLRLRKILGIEVRLDYSWFIIFTLITVSLVQSFSREMSIIISLIIGILTSLLFFASVLAHELSHSFVARANGVPVHSITLFIFGGVAHITQEPKRPRDEFFMALAGPGTSIAIAILFGAIWFATSNLSKPIAALASRLGMINGMLATFNLIPGFPLDGGRVLRSIIWRVTGNLRKATQVASIVGRGVAYIFIFIGIWRIFHRDWLGGLWLAFIGWFLENAAANSYRQMAWRDTLQGHTAKEVMVTDCPYIPHSLKLEELVHDYILHTGRRCFPVVDEERVLGIVTLHNVKEISKERWSSTEVGAIMTPLEQLQTVHPDDGLFDVLEQMTHEDVNQLPVIDDGKLVGMVARDNVLAFIHTRTELGI
ncbi:CBS domain-containing protein [Candidatus Poribacteria bacterium]|nr:CBS domain-containing protein [Candidatus Poribacteria bacterium]